jgi:bacteriocin-like protein
MKLLLLSLAFCLLFITPLRAESLAVDEAANVSGLYALSNITTSGSVKEMTDNELAAVEGGDAATVFQLEPGFITVTTSSGNINSMGQYDLPHPVFPVGDQAFVLRESCGAECTNMTVVRPGGDTYLNVTHVNP